MDLTNLGLVAWALSWLGMPYWYGCICQRCTAALLASKAKQYPKHYTSGRMPTYRRHVEASKKCTDCSGLIKGYVKALTTNANGIYKMATTKGGIKTLPEVKGLLLWRDGHIGVYIGDGWAVEARGFDFGVVRTRVKDRTWTNWCYCPLITYVDGDVAAPVAGALGDRTLRLDANGTDVKALQEMLIALGYVLPEHGADSDFGTETEAAVRAFQTAAGIEVDGIVGVQTLAALLAAVSDDEPDETEDGTVAGDALIVTGGSVNIRTGPGTQYAKVAIARARDKLVAVNVDGWRPVLINGEVRWVSEKYIREGE